MMIHPTQWTCTPTHLIILTSNTNNIPTPTNPRTQTPHVTLTTLTPQTQYQYPSPTQSQVSLQFRPHMGFQFTLSPRLDQVIRTLTTRILITAIHTMATMSMLRVRSSRTRMIGIDSIRSKRD
jgi:hypothetical protein